MSMPKTLLGGLASEASFCRVPTAWWLLLLCVAASCSSGTTGDPVGSSGASGGGSSFESSRGSGGGGGVSRSMSVGAGGSSARGGSSSSASAGGAGRGGEGGVAAGGAAGASQPGVAGGGTGSGGSSRTGGSTGSGGVAGASASGGAASGGSSGTGGMGGGGAVGSGGLASGGAGGSRATTSGAAGADGDAGTSSITLWIAGDSTVMTYAAGNTSGTNGTSLEGWGQEIGQYFSSKVTVSNQAIGGRSVAFFMWSVAKDSSGAYECVDSQGTPKFEVDSSGNKIDTAQWSRIKSGVQPGDFLLVQFGTNDQTSTCPRYVSTADFETDLGIMADTMAAKGARAIFVTPMPHRSFTGTKVNNALLPYANAMKDEATKKTVEVEDLNLRAAEYYESVGDSYLQANIFDGGVTHFVKAGAVELAKLIVGEIKKNNGPLAAYLQ